MKRRFSEDILTVHTYTRTQYAYKIYSSWYIIYFNTDTMIAHIFSMEDYPCFQKHFKDFLLWHFWKEEQFIIAHHDYNFYNIIVPYIDNFSGIN